MKKAHAIPVVGTIEKRQLSKLKRKRGLMYLKSKDIDPVKNCQKNDPLFHVKGIERHLKLNTKKRPKFNWEK